MCNFVHFLLTMRKRLTYKFSYVLVTLCLVLFLGNRLSGQDNDDFVILRNSLQRTLTLTSLSSYVVNAIDQDDRGLIWFGTVNGLFYFDNYNVVSYKCEESINAMINSLLCVGDSLFIGTEDGLSILNIGTGDVSNLLIGNNITVMCAADDIVLVGTNNGIFQIRRKSGEIRQLEIGGFDKSLNIRDIIYNQFTKQWWIATDIGVFVKNDDEILQHCKVRARTICVFDENRLFLGTENGLYVAENESDSLKSINLEVAGIECPIDVDVTSIVGFDDDEILVGTNGKGLFRYNLSNDSSLNITRFGMVNLSLSDDYIKRLFKDASGRFWIATTLGINGMMKNYSSFTSFSLYNGSTYNLPVRCIAQVGENELFMGTDDGVFVFNRIKNSYSSFEDYFGLKDQRFANVQVNKVYYDRDRYLWVGTRNRGVFCFDTKKKSFLDGLPDFSHELINDIVDDKQGSIWIATSKRVSRIIMRDRSVQNICDGYSRGLLCDDGIMYITINQGLVRYSIQDNSIETFDLEDNILYNITKGDDGKLYIGSYHNGVMTFDVEAKTFGVFKNANDGVSQIAYSVLFDKEGNAWVSSNFGIWTYNKKTQSISIYNVRDGLQGDDFTMNGAMRGNYGMMYFGGYNGFTMFNPLNIIQEKTEPKLLVYNFSTSSGNDIMNVRNNDTIILNYDGNSFAINFSAYNLMKISKIRYEYKLEGYDKQWTMEGSTKHQAEYRNLPAGTYTFKLLAINEANIQNREPYQLTIIVKPIWYDTICFRVCVLLIALIAVVSVIYSTIIKENRKIKYAKEINKLEKKMFHLKSQALQMRMNPHFLYNTMNSIQSFILTNDTVMASMYLSSFAKLMRKILGNANHEKVLLSDELETIRLYLDLERLRLNNRFKYEIKVDEDIQVNKVEIASMLLQPFAENAVIHGLANKAEGGFLRVEVKLLEDKNMLFVIEDNGIGREAAERRRRELGKTKESYATNITKQRLEILNEISQGEYSVKIIDLYDEDGEACGTRVEIIMCCYD